MILRHGDVLFTNVKPGAHVHNPLFASIVPLSALMEQLGEAY
jgi:hypothetical protein